MLFFKEMFVPAHHRKPKVKDTHLYKTSVPANATNKVDNSTVAHENKL